VYLRSPQGWSCRAHCRRSPYLHQKKHRMKHLFALLSSTNFSFLGSSDLLHSVLSLLSLFARYLLFLVHTLSSKSVLGLEFLEKIHVIIHQGESSGLSTTKVCAEPETSNDIRCSFVHLCQFLRNFFLWHCGTSRVKDIHNHLPSGQKPVGHEFSGANSSRNVSHV